MKDILAEIDRWQEAGKRVALATVVQVYGSAPRPLGAKLAVSEEGAMVGSVSGGCVESATVQEALEVLSTGKPRLVAYGIADETGLPCQDAAQLKPKLHRMGSTSGFQPSPLSLRSKRTLGLKLIFQQTQMVGHIRILGLLAAGLLTMFFAMACRGGDEPRQTSVEQAELHAEEGRYNVALLGGARASAEESGRVARHAIDDDPDSFWNSRTDQTPQWLSIDLDQTFVVDSIELVVTQSAAGPTTHEVRLQDGSGNWTLYKRFADVETEDEQVLHVAVDPPRPVKQVLVVTLRSQGWVAWREVRVFSESGGPPIQLEEIAGGLAHPIQVTHAGDGSGRLFVVEQRGRIRIIKDGVVNDTPFLDISGRVKTPDSCCGESGLLNVAFPPDYAAKQHFYVSYNGASGGDGASNVNISRFKTSADPDRAEPDSEEVLLTIEQLHWGHNGGRLAFGPQDGYLYITVGEDHRDVPFNDLDSWEEARDNSIAQNLGELYGKILRIDVESDTKPYGIPASNPYADVDGLRGEIWASGLRNSWGLAFDRQSGDLYITDAGHLSAEETNFQPASSSGGENYGWPLAEGSRKCGAKAGPCPSAAGLTLPVTEYHRTQGCAIVGGAVARGASMPSLEGAFLYADFCRGRIWALNRADADSQGAWRIKLLARGNLLISSIGEDEEGNIYISHYASDSGRIYLLGER